MLGGPLNSKPVWSSTLRVLDHTGFFVCVASKLHVSFATIRAAVAQCNGKSGITYATIRGGS